MEAVLSDYDLYLKGFALTVGLVLVSGVASLVFGALLAAARVGPIWVLSKAASLYVTIFRNTPLLMVFIFVAIAMPRIGITFKFVEEIAVGDWSISAFFFRACVALTLYTSAFVCEAFRSGINAVPLGQAEAARALGLTFTQNMTNVVMPQALRAVVPPLTSVIIALTKNTSVAAAFGIAEATSAMRTLGNRYGDQVVEIFFFIAIGYIVVVELLALGSYALERRWKVASR
ncbi:amino acid ABC transporter permease [Nocardioides sp. ChNu-153]|uniref:amino acid ABC transporter permease n=1 Tax=unclassified Nocardioides TaxID=2615069 RepID=UPI0024052FEA|nr:MULTISPECIES: amino acid ABC transporter permease [unclassified Nocardioides]MDF9715079.1 amino acid ABC transporter permease [Nocardioides sp. ChNu-99]MDN7122348.1 amino acid ABC transporter permease [Nocardioides sp. ChNu-153]